ncbi:Protein kinase domain [Carpediemonas membranifera]|uniref:non-specific serine/threonine protein kinase n=1 Tax=Carpediemonas membranifera TaxID=201153 RepID=A0A8J6AX71_9EUKA|nr:Protein kinase domain [Carpediemonas membranifera]|eukprot:KAG9389509.1 Protein kinase domain [Carpediemonas membranifera]
MSQEIRKRIDKYEVGRTIGSGAFGKVKYGVNTVTGEAVAIKILDRQRLSRANMSAQIKKEIRVLKALNHDSIVRLHDVLTSKTKIFLVMELITGGELFERLATSGKFSESTGRMFLHQLVSGLDYMHKKGIAHRDLKPENLLLNADGDLKISDFGLASEDAARMLKTVCGTPNYIAPEILRSQPYDGKRADIWSVGVILYVMLAGFMPFEDPSQQTLIRNIVEARYNCPSWFSEDARDLISKMINPDVAQRITIPDILAHPWMLVDSESRCPSPTKPKQVSKTYTEAEGEKVHAPPDITAFDVIGLSGALNLTPMLNRDVEEKGLGIFRATCFVSHYAPLQILEALLPVLQRLKANCQIHEPTFKMRVSAPTMNGILQISVQVFRITDNRFIAEFRRNSGDVLDFHSFFNDVLENIPSDLIDTTHYAANGQKGLKLILQRRKESVAMMQKAFTMGSRKHRGRADSKLPPMSGEDSDDF